VRRDLLLAILLLPGCAVVREARIAQDPASAVPGERTPSAAELGLPSKGPVPLDAVVRAALRAHPSVVAARRAEEAARAAVTEAEAARLPQVAANASAGLADGKGSPGGPTRFRSGGFDVSFLVFDFGRTAALGRSAGEQWLAAQADLRAAEVDAAAAARAGYYDLVRKGELLEVARETVRQFEVHLEQVSEFVKVGTRIPYDETKAEVDLDTARIAEVRARNALLTAQATLANAVGLAEVLDWAPDPASPSPEVPEEFDAAWGIARDHRPDLAAASARERAASALLDARIADLYPALDLTFGYSAAGTSLPASWAWTGTAALRWVPFDGFRNLATIEEATAGLRGARAARARTEQRDWLEVRTAWLALGEARERLGVAGLAVRSAGETLELARGLFDVGTGTSVELADAAQALALTKASEVQARADERAAAAELARAIGIGVPEPEAAPGRNE